MREYWSATGNGFIRYLDLPGDKTPIVFVHGLGCAGSYDYPAVASQPSLAQHRRVLIDLLGAGYSDKPEGFGYAVSDHAAVLAELVSSIDLPDFVLFGHSAGGAIALELAHAMRDSVCGLILSEANIDPSPPTAGSFKIASRPEADFLEHGYEALLRVARQNEDRRWAASLAHWSPLAVWRLSYSLMAGQTPNGREVFYDLAMPRAYLIGDKSLPDPDLEELPRHGIETLLVPNSGHAMAWENPEATAGAIASALATWAL